MNEEVKALVCDRQNDLIGFLYGELSEPESRSFQRHMHDCPACGHDVETLKTVRHSVVAWRNESLGNAVSREAISGVGSTVGRRRPSASAALREFFDLSPLWMKGALAFATLLFCLFAGLALARWRDVPSTPLATNGNSEAASEQKLNALVEKRVEEELKRMKADGVGTPNPTVADNNSPQHALGRPSGRRAEVANNFSTKNARRPLSSVERAELASDLRLVSEGNDGELDLLDEGINK